MAINFPTSLDVFTDPTASDQLNLPSHSGQHTDLNNAVEALEAKVGADSSAVTTSLDYKVAQLEAIAHGKILQVVSTTKTDTFSTASTSYVDVTGLSATITPTSSASNILVMFNVGVGTSTATTIDFVLDRDGTDICVSSTGATALTFPDDAFDFEDVSNVFLDSPATTSAVTYQVQTKTSTGTAYVNRRGTNASYISTSTITVMEVAA